MRTTSLSSISSIEEHQLEAGASSTLIQRLKLGRKIHETNPELLDYLDQVETMRELAFKNGDYKSLPGILEVHKLVTLELTNRLKNKHRRLYSRQNSLTTATHETHKV